jgi:UDP-GlcNAc:undecaprenyl-phosphate GlcNAc-1-phosphate transferase
MMSPFAIIVLALMISLVCGFGVRWAAQHFQIIDVPTGGRKIHTRPVALLGGVAVIVSTIIAFWIASPDLFGGYLLPKHLIGVSIAAGFLLVGGALDDRLNLPPLAQFFFPVTATLVIIASGIGIDYISSPFGGVLYFDQWNIQVFEWKGTPYFFTVWADLFTFVWLMVMMYTTKFLDGLDGLVSGISVIGLVIIALLSYSATVGQPETGLLALIAASCFAGFLVFNWHPASMFLGESGSLFAGFILGVLAIISGGKIATTLLIIGIPLLDVVWVVVRRVLVERRSPFQADRKHLHLRLIDAGFSQRQAALLLYAVTLVFGASALLLQGEEKLIALIILTVVMVLIAVSAVYVYRKRKATQ